MNKILQKIMSIFGWSSIPEKIEFSTEELETLKVLGFDPEAIKNLLESDLAKQFMNQNKQTNQSTQTNQTNQSTQTNTVDLDKMKADYEAQIANEKAKADQEAKARLETENKLKLEQEKVKILEATPEEIVSFKTIKNETVNKNPYFNPNGFKNHLFGIEHKFFSLDYSWNRCTSERKIRTSNYTERESIELKQQFEEYSEMIAGRMNYLQQNGLLQPLMAGNIDYSELDSALGQQYLVRRSDAIITYIKRLESCEKFFPVVYNVQDKMEITNSFEGKSFSQSFQTGRVFAGNFKFQPDITQVKDIMFKFKLSDLKKLEREYIGYLNREGSDPIKWAFIEWLLVQCAVIQFNEKEQRRIKGIRVEPTDTKASYFMYASDGVLTTLQKKINENAVMVLDYKSYSRSTIYDYVKNFVREVYRLRGRTNDLVLCMNQRDWADFREAFRDAYGKDTDFKDDAVIKYYDLAGIYLIPNMENRQDMWMMPAGTLEIHEDKPGEFFSYYFQRDFEELFVMSYGKEGTFAFAGRKFATQAELKASKGKHTNIFMNFPVTELAANAVTVDVLAQDKENELFASINNTAATVFTDFVNAKQGVAYFLYCNGLTNPTTVAKSGKFSNITAAYAPTALKDYLKVIYDPKDDKFIELERKVGGVLAVNANAKAPEYVETN